MNELKLFAGDLDAFEARLRSLGGAMGEPGRVGNWYLETSPCRVLKAVQAGGKYTLLELRKLDAGYAFVQETPLADASSLRLDKVAWHNVLHKTVRPWTVKGQSVDVLAFDDIGVFACVNYEDGKREEALGFIHRSLELAEPRYLEVPFNVLKRRQLGFPDFDEG
ncbi:MAG: hypothetical protein ACLPPF_00880 [Rhodomicrobium sp.]